MLVVRVHPEILESEPIPKPLVTKQIWKERFEDIRAFERYFDRQGYVIRKFFLHITQKEQLKRLASGSTSRRRTGSSTSEISRSARAGTTT